MNRFPERLETMRVLLTNDDGVDAPGLRVLLRVAKSITKDIWIVAPEHEQSGAGHSLTLNAPLRLNRYDDRKFGVTGTPTDCVVMAIHRLMKDHPPDLVLSGINMGGNMGEDITYSGTVAAAMESTVLRVPAIALSQQFRDGPKAVKWKTAETFAADIIRKLCKAGWPKGTLINVNFPGVGPKEIAGIEVTSQGQREIGDNLHERTDPRGRTYFWVGRLQNLSKPKRGTDLAAIDANRISVTPIHIDFTHRRALKRLREVLQ